MRNPAVERFERELRDLKLRLQEAEDAAERFRNDILTLEATIANVKYFVNHGTEITS